MAVLARSSGVPGPTIKHYIREGLLPAPAMRTSKNMAYYDVRMVERIRTIKRLQRERFLPLRVIASLVEPWPSAKLRADADVDAHTLRALGPALDRSSEITTRRRGREVEQTFGLSAKQLDRLEHAGVLTVKGSGATAGYEGLDLQLLDVLADAPASPMRHAGTDSRPPAISIDSGR